MRPILRMVGSLLGMLFAFSALVPSAHAQDLFFGGSPSTTPLGDAYLFRWQSAVQRVDAPVFAGLYCEELEYGLFEVRVTLSDGVFSTGTTSTFSTFELGCDYLGMPDSRDSQVVVDVPVALDQTTLSLLTRVAKTDRLTIEARIDPNDGFYEGGDPYYEVTNNLASIEIGRANTFGVLSGRVDFGPVQTQVVWGTGALVPSVDCDPGDYRLFGDFELPQSAGGGVVEDSDYGVICARPQLDLFTGEYRLVVTGLGAPPERILTGEVDGLQVKMAYTLTSGGLLPSRAWVQLPNGHTLHRVETYTLESATAEVPSPRGTRWVELTIIESGFIASLEELEASTTPGNFFLISQRLPFALRMNSLSFTRIDHRRGLVGAVLGARPLKELPVHGLDPRHPTQGGFRTNDLFARAVMGAEDPIAIVADGLMGRFTHSDGAGLTAFPRARLVHSAGALAVSAGALGAQLLPIDTVTLDNQTACPGCGSAGASTRKVLLGRTGTWAGVGPDGTVAMPVRHEAPFTGDPNTPSDDLPSEELGFGPPVTVGNTTRPTFLRGGAGPGSGDMLTQGVLALSGHILSPSVASPAEAMLGTWRTEVNNQDGLDFAAPIDARPLADPETRRGNGFFAGYTIGPEVYSDAQRQPVVGQGRSLDGSTLSIAFPTATPGVPDIRNVSVNAGTKLVVRGAITGVVNVDASNSPQPQVYGYALNFNRFAFSLVDNTLAPTTWVDGEVAVPGHGNFRVPFSSLGLTCTGQLAGGTVDFARLTPQSLRAWKTPWEVSAVGFKPKGTDTTCSMNPRELEVTGRVSVAALSKDLDLAARWSPAGTPGNINVASLSARLDPSETEPGFEIQTAKDDLRLGFNPDNVELGWFDFGARLFLPFWESFDVRLRLQNLAAAAPSTAPTAAPSLVVPRTFPPAAPTGKTLVDEWATKWGRLSNQDLTGLFAVTAFDKSEPLKTQNQEVIDAIKLEAKKSWVFDLKGDVKWRPRTTDISGRFVAANDKTTTLPVITVKTAVPFVTSRNTQYTMGVDADLRKLQDINMPSLKVDLKNPETIKKIDDFLTGTPLNLSGRPVEGALGTLRGAVTDLASSVKSQLAPTIKKALKDGIAAVFNDLRVGDLLDLAGKAVSVVQSTASQAIVAVFDPLSGLVDQAIEAIVAGPDAALIELYDTLPQKIVDARNGGQAAKEAAQTYLSGTARTVIGTSRSAVANAKVFLSDIDKRVTEARQALTALDLQLAKTMRGARCALRNPKMAPRDDADPNPCEPGVPGIYNLLDVANSPFLKCDVEKNPALQEVAKLRTKLFAVIDKLAASGDSGLNKIVTDLGKKLPAINNQKFDTDGVAKLFIQLSETAKWLKEKIDLAYYRVVGWPPNATAEQKKKPTFCGTVTQEAGPKLEALATKLRGFVGDLYNNLGQVEFTVSSTISSLNSQAPNAPLTTFQTKLKGLVSVLGTLDAQLVQLDTFVQGALADSSDLPPVTVASVRLMMDNAARDITKLVGVESPWIVGDKSFLSVVADELAAPVNGFIASVASSVDSELKALLAQIPLPKRDELLQHLTNLVVESDFIKELITLVTDNLSFLEDKANEMVNLVLDQLTLILQHALDFVAKELGGALKSALDDAKGSIASFPIQAASIKGAAQINAQELEWLQVSAKFTAGKKKDQTPSEEAASKESKSDTAFAAELKVVSWKTNGKAAGCSTSAGGFNNAYDATISASNIPIVIGSDPKNGLKISKLLLGFSLDDGYPIGVFGGINTTGELKVAEFKLRNINLAFGAGKTEAYLGARAQAIFQSFNCEVAFFAGKACNLDPIKFVDPEVAKFLPNVTASDVFTGAYVRGGAQIPITDVGCLLRFGFGVEAALWFFVNPQADVTIGGLVGGSVYGKALCLGAIRGGIRISASYESKTDEFSGVGEFYAGGGIGFSCDEDTWTSVQAIRNDDGCATVDISATAELKGGKMDVGPVDTSGVD